MTTPTRYSPRQCAMLQEMGLRVWQPRTSPGPREVEPEPTRRPRRPDAQLVPAPAAALAPGDPAARRPGPTSQEPDLGQMGWDELERTVASCHACSLCQTRTKTVFGIGSRQSSWMVIGEAPGEQEDLQGEPFVGAAGQLLDRMLAAAGLTRQAVPTDAGQQSVYIANTLKCRPPGNRNPQGEELQRCEPYLHRQIQLLQPRIILALGRFAAQSLLNSQEPIGRLRGRVHQALGVPAVVTYHPAYLLRNPQDKAKAWQDLCLALDTLEASAPPT